MSTTESPDVDGLLADLDRELSLAEKVTLADAGLDAPADEPAPDPAFFKVELLDGERVRVPQDSPDIRQAFIEAHRAERAAQRERQDAHDAAVAEYLSMTPLERANRYTDRQAAALEEMAKRGRVL